MPSTMKQSSISYTDRQHRLSIVELERIETERREKQFLEERKQIEICRPHEEKSHVLMSDPLKPNKVQHKSPKIIQNSKQSKSNETQRLTGEISNNYSPSRPSFGKPQSSVVSETKEPKKQSLKPSLVKQELKAHTKHSKSNKGSVRFKQGFEIIPDFNYKDDEGFVARSVRLAMERDEEARYQQSFIIPKRQSSVILNTYPVTPNAVTQSEGFILKNSHIDLNDKQFDDESTTVERTVNRCDLTTIGHSSHPNNANLSNVQSQQYISQSNLKVVPLTGRPNSLSKKTSFNDGKPWNGRIQYTNNNT